MLFNGNSILGTLLISSLTLAPIAIAGPTGVFTHLDPESLRKEYSRSEISVETFKLEQINWEREFAAAAARHESASCGEALIDTDSGDILELLEENFEEVRLADALRELIVQGKIIRVVSVSDGDEGDIESCSRRTIRLYSDDGEVLDLYFDYNT